MRVAIYVRVSTTGQVEAQTIEQQVSRLQSEVEKQQWELRPEHIFRDDGYSGAKLSRPGLDSLRDQAALAEFEMVLVTEPDRLARNYVHQMLLLEELREQGIAVEFLERPMSDDPHDQLLLQIRSAVAQYERSLITERMRRGRLRKIRAGQLVPWTVPPYGIQPDPEKPRDPEGVKLDEVTAVIVAEMFHWYLEPGNTLYGVAKRLSDKAIPTPRGKSHWHPSTVRNILRNPVYKGMACSQRYQSVPSQKRKSALAPVGAGKTPVERPETEWIPQLLPAVVSEEIFAQVQEKLAHNQRTAARNNTVNQYLLRALVSCGYCRLSANARTMKGKYHYYVCAGRHVTIKAIRGHNCPARFLPAGPLDELVWQDLVQVLTQPEMINQALTRAHGGHWLPQALQARLHNMGNVLKQLERQQERLLTAYLAEVLDLPEFERKRHQLKQKHSAIQQQVRQLQASASQRTELAAAFDTIEAFCQHIQPVLHRASFAQRRQLVERLIDRVIVKDEAVEIRYVIPIQPKDKAPRLPFMLLRTDYR